MREPEDVVALLRCAQKRRHVGETKMNERSSRSHCVVTLRVSRCAAARSGGTMEYHGKLHLVDLAGSECAKNSGISGDDVRSLEAANINKSLLSLGQVIRGLRKNQPFSYRQSKLTRLLKESLGGRCKTMIIATVSPALSAEAQTVSTLDYVEQAQGIALKPQPAASLRLANGQTDPRAQLAEAQVALATKQVQLESLESRAIEAESSLAECSRARTVAETDLAAFRAAKTTVALSQCVEAARFATGASRSLRRSIASSQAAQAAHEESARAAASSHAASEAALIARVRLLTSQVLGPLIPLLSADVRASIAGLGAAADAVAESAAALPGVLSRSAASLAEAQSGVAAVVKVHHVCR